MTDRHGTPIWYELTAADPAVAAAFYQHAIGWSVRDFGSDDYRIFVAPDGEGIAGLMKPVDDGRHGWHGYIGVDDVDAAVGTIEASGGRVLRPPMTLEGVGRMAMLADPGGAAFHVMRGFGEPPSTPFKRMALGHAEWNELSAADDTAALAFYTAQFGWTKSGAMPMGAMGDYSFLSHDGGVIGAVMRAPPGESPRWTYYFRVGAIDAAKERIVAAGGAIAMGPVEVPGGDWVIVARDPQGAPFGVVGKRD